MGRKDDYAIVLDYLPYGYPLEGKMKPLVQAVGEDHLALLELSPVRGASFAQGEKVYIGPDKRDKVYYIVGRLSKDKLTETAKAELEKYVEKYVGERQKKFVDFFNSSQAINTRLHMIELLPGFGRKHTECILKAREEKSFESFEDLKERVPNVPNPAKAIEKRIIEEILNAPRNMIFVI